ncbi:MAG: beta-mannanase [Planctomycetes bacterium]|nr:beta-mannanase [Planctomycetota bacterium]
MPESPTFTKPGEFIIGCNYWASHAGAHMWSDWQPKVVEKDLQQLAKNQIKVLRVFPTWSVFQPLRVLYTHSLTPFEYSHGEEPLPKDEAGQAGVSVEAMEHFKILADLAEKYDIKLVVGLVTGWMSSRLFVPPALERLNAISDPVSIMWQVRFVRYFVKSFKDHPAVIAWDLGNESNCMCPAQSREIAWLWSASIANAIRAEQNNLPIISGMHGLGCDPKGKNSWLIQDQGELTDVLTTHPYPAFTKHCDHDPMTTIRTILHATAQSRFYADIGGKPCFAEEVGNLGPMFCGEEETTAFARAQTFSLWAHDCHGSFWWCAYDELPIHQAPYEWNAMELELGLFHEDRSAKPIVAELGKFVDFLQRLPIDNLPPRTTEAVCILTAQQDQWAAGYSSFILAKQAGFDLEYQYVEQPLKDSQLYLVPSVCGSRFFSGKFWRELQERVRNGATLYLSHNNCLISTFKEVFGMEVETRSRRSNKIVEITLSGLPEKLTFSTQADFKLQLHSLGAEVLGQEADGNPAFTCAQYGKGKVYFLSVPLETNLATITGAFHEDAAQPFYKLYQQIAREVTSNRVVSKDHPQVGITEHPLEEAKRIVVMINYSPEAVTTAANLAKGWRIGECWYGNAPASGACEIGANNASVFTIFKS